MLIAGTCYLDYLKLSKVVGEIIENGSDSYFGSEQSRSAAPHPLTRLMCNFCRHNGESKKVYSSHVLKQADGTVACPILRQYVCPVCGATGDGAHTLKYCPLSDRKESLYCKGGRNSAGFLGHQAGQPGLGGTAGPGGGMGGSGQGPRGGGGWCDRQPGPCVHGWCRQWGS
uniref:Nanos-type domain-containing protein n=1 Tax=Pelusios castaneus TaxID=367368 RepID=A0A8C8SCX5_9SAUR